MQYKTFSKKQLMAMSWWNRPGLRSLDGILCDGAVRAGKTVCLTDGFFLWSMASFDKQVFGLCGKTIASLRRNIVEHLGQWLGGLFTVREHRSENKLIVSDRQGHVNTYYLFGGQDESAYQLIQGITLAGILLDEAALMPRSFVEQAAARCSVPGAKLWLSCNPEGPEHWFYKEWVCKASEKHLLRLRMTMEDNPSLSPEVKARYRRLYTGVFYERYVLGRWVAAEGRVYDFGPEHVVHDLPQAGRYYISVDYGTRNPFSAGLWCVAGGVAYRVREFYHDGRATGRMLTDEQYHAALVALAGGVQVEKVIVDPSASSLIATIRHHGVFSVRRARNAVLPGIRLVAQLLQAGRLKIGAGCRDTIREFGAYRWEEGKDAPVKENDHAMDDVRYFCATVMGRIGAEGQRQKTNALSLGRGILAEQTEKRRKSDEKVVTGELFAHVGQGDGALRQPAFGPPGQGAGAGK